MRGDQPASGDAGRAHAGLPVRPFRSVQAIILAQKIQRGVERDRRGGNRAGRSSARGHRRCSSATPTAEAARSIAAERGFSLRIERGMHIGEQGPIGTGSTPLVDPSQRMTVIASRAQGFAGNLLVLNPVLGHVHHRLGLFGRKTVRTAQGLDDQPRIGRLQSHTVQPHHPLDGLFPTFGRGANPGDAGEVALLVLGMTPGAFGDDHGVRDGDSILRRRCGCARAAACAAASTGALALRRKLRKGTEEEHGSRHYPSHTVPAVDGQAFDDHRCFLNSKAAIGMQSGWATRHGQVNVPENPQPPPNEQALR